MLTKATGGHGIGPPCKPPSRVQRVRSAIRDDGAAEAKDGEGQSAVCGAPSDPLDERREPAKRAVCWGRRLLVLFAKESGSFKSHSPQPEGRAKPLRGQSPRLFDAEAHQPDWRAKEVSSPHPGPLPQGEREVDRKPLRLHGRPQTKTAAF